jgi:hypothetical protein
MSPNKDPEFRIPCPHVARDPVQEALRFASDFPRSPGFDDPAENQPMAVWYEAGDLRVELLR